ncbi:hypothetical protein BN990_00310 [Virgibacillus salexigens]|uniref:Uncharacterized protein n=1 Tax=Virgibacillus massiliensis TaxID=1462526 RepID=A0A024Q6A3_9BACI|nr:hypothetical protein BN990_00310 [Virgibacillus massiliensis]
MLNRLNVYHNAVSIFGLVDKRSKQISIILREE